MTSPETGKLSGELFNECAEWIWEQLQEDGFFISGELVDLILGTEREMGIHTGAIEQVAEILEQEFTRRGISANPYPLDRLMIQEVLKWEDDFLGFAGINREES